MKCEHDLSEREMEVHDGYCPICSSKELSHLKERLAMAERVIEACSKALRTCETDHSTQFTESSYDEELVLSALQSIDNLNPSQPKP